MIRALPRGRRAASRAIGPVRRWITLAVLAWLALMLAGREHALAALGVELACLHPGDAPRAHHAEPHETTTTVARAGAEVGGERVASGDPSHRDATASDGADDDDCPPGCTDCACGAAPCSPSTPIGVAAPGWTMEMFAMAPACEGPTNDGLAVERPPRIG